MSGVLMLPDASTASSRSRPLRATSCGGPSHCGRATAHTSKAQPASASHLRHVATGAAPSAAAMPSNAYGMRKAAPASSRAGGSMRAINHGSGISTNSQGQANSSMRHPRSGRIRCKRVAHKAANQGDQGDAVVFAMGAERRIDQDAADAAAEVLAAAAGIEVLEPALAGVGGGMRIAQGQPAQEHG